MGFLKFVAIQQTVVWAVFSLVAVAGILARLRWGVRGSAAVVVLAWPVFAGTVLLNELRTAPQLLELNSFAQLFRALVWQPATLATVALAVALWLARRAPTARRAVVLSVGSGAVWAYVLPVPLALIALALAAVIPMGTAEYHYVDFRPMGLEVLETGTPKLAHYTGSDIPLRYRAQLDGREIEIEIVPAEGLTAQFRIRAVTPESPRFEVEPPLRGGCGFGHVRAKDNVIAVDWSTVPESRGICYGDGAPDAALTVRFVGSDTTLVLHGPIVRAGEYDFYDSL